MSHTISDPTALEHRGPGRPRTSSRASIEEAAAELFIEKTFAATSIDDIAQRAGVSRTTFFNYFASKGDLLFLDVDRALDRFERELAVATEPEPLDAIEAALVRSMAEFGTTHVPLAVSQQDVMGVAAEVRTARLRNLARNADILTEFLAKELGRPTDDLLVKVAATMIAGAVSAAGMTWARDGAERAPFTEYIERAMVVVRNGLGRAL